MMNTSRRRPGDSDRPGNGGSASRCRPSRTRPARSSAPQPATTASFWSLHEGVACAHYRRACESVVLERERVPQLAEVSPVLTALNRIPLATGRRHCSVERFLGAFEEDGFYATQYLRRPGQSPHPLSRAGRPPRTGRPRSDELGDPVFADLYRRFGQTAKRVSSPDVLRALIQVFWFTRTGAGVVLEGGRPRVYGAALVVAGRGDGVAVAGGPAAVRHRRDRLPELRRHALHAGALRRRVGRPPGHRAEPIPDPAVNLVPGDLTRRAEDAHSG